MSNNALSEKITQLEKVVTDMKSQATSSCTKTKIVPTREERLGNTRYIIYNNCIQLFKITSIFLQDVVRKVFKSLNDTLDDFEWNTE